MASYEEQLETFGKMIDEEEEKKKRGRTRSNIKAAPSTSGGSGTSSGATLQPAAIAASAAGSTAPQTFKAQPQVRVVGFQVGGAINSTATTTTPPVAIPASVPEGGSTRRTKRSGDGSPSPTSPSLSHSLDGLKEYKSQLDGWSASGSPSSPGAVEERKSPSKPTTSSSSSTAAIGVPPAKLSSSHEAGTKPLASPTRHSPYQPLQPSASPSSKPMTSPLLQAPSASSSSSAVIASSSSSSTISSSSAGKSKASSVGPSPKGVSGGKAPSRDADERESDDETPAASSVGPSAGTEKKPLTRAERRAIQEAQRAAKQARLATQKPGAHPQGKAPLAAVASGAPPGGTALSGSGSGRKAAAPAAGGGGAAAAVAPKVKQYDDPKQKVQASKQSVVALEESKKQVALFSHLPQFERHTTLSMKIGFSPSERIHPAVVNLGLKYASGTVAGSNSRCVAMLTAFKKVIRDFQTPPGTALHRTLEPHLKPQIQFLTDCRPHSISMGNAINYVKREIPKTQSMADEEAKEFLVRRIETFIEERIVLADQAIATYGVSKINDGDVVLTYAASHPVECVLKLAHAEGKRFRVILVESTPKREAKNLMQKLVKEGIHCTLVLLNAVSYVMKEVTKVFLGAYTLLVNGHLMSRAGTAMVAMVASAYNVPVIVCCETYKFCERVQIDSICFNELGDPEELIATAEQDNSGRTEALKDWRDNEHLKLLNLVYDVTPSSFITMVVTEVGMIPPTSVPVILREYPLQSMEQAQG